MPREWRTVVAEDTSERQLCATRRLLGWDAVVAAGEASSRAALVVAAVDRDRRRRRAEQDATILAAVAPDGDLDELAAYQAQVPMADLD